VFIIIPLLLLNACGVVVLVGALVGWRWTRVKRLGRVWEPGRF
jgi:hypothetical protein